MSLAVTREDDRPNAVEYAAVGLRGPQETVSHIARINVIAGDRIHRVIAARYRTLAWTCACPRNIERCDGAVLSA
jgi:hypothetical protein